MILADTCVWVAHFDRDHSVLSDALMQGQVLMHDFVIGELACGLLRPRAETLLFLNAMPRIEMAAHAEVMTMLEDSRLYTRGIGWVDAHLLASALLARARLLTDDRALQAAARVLGVAA